MKIITTDHVSQNEHTINKHLIDGVSYNWIMGTYEKKMNTNWYHEFIEFLENKDIDTIVLYSIIPFQFTNETYIRIRWSTLN
jgi:hypothetical protein